MNTPRSLPIKDLVYEVSAARVNGKMAARLLRLFAIKSPKGHAHVQDGDKPAVSCGSAHTLTLGVIEAVDDVENVVAEAEASVVAREGLPGQDARQRVLLADVLDPGGLNAGVRARQLREKNLELSQAAQVVRQLPQPGVGLVRGATVGIQTHHF